MAYQVLYRQWGPERFSQVIGQEAVIRTLRRQVETGRIAHAYLFSGTRGTGKTTMARIFSRAINCLNPIEGEPCDACENCLAIKDAASLDIEEIDAASNNGVDEIRSLRDRIKYPPQNAKYRVYIIDEVHMLSTGAFNALLKTLEEPPPHAVMILATTEPQRLPATILSRCQRFDFKRISVPQITGRLREAAGEDRADEDALMAIARAAEGGMRDAFSLLDLCQSLSDRVTVDVVDAALGSAGRAFLSRMADALAASDTSLVLRLTGQAVRDGRDIAVLARELCAYIRILLVVKETGPEAAEILEISPAQLDAYSRQAQAMGVEKCLRVMELFSRAEPDMRWASQPRTIFELAAVRACRPEDHMDIDALRQRIETLERQIENGVALKAANPAPDAAEEPAPPEKAAPLISEAMPAQPVQPAPAQSEQPARPAKEAATVWKATLQALKSGLKMQVYSALNNKARLEALTSSTAIVAFDPANEIFLRMMSGEANLKVLEDALSGAAGRPIHARLALAGQMPPPEPVPETAPGQTSAAPPWVQDAFDVFGRENVDIIEKGEE